MILADKQNTSPLFPKKNKGLAGPALILLAALTLLPNCRSRVAGDQNGWLPPGSWKDRDWKLVNKLLKEPKTLPGTDAKTGEIFQDAGFEEEFFENYRKDKVVRRVKKIDYYNNTRLANTMYMQGSGRRRLFDVNIILRALYQGRLKHKKLGTLEDRFADALYVDIGSSVLFMKGAPTVRDIYDDPHLRQSGRIVKILATDINDYIKEPTRYIDIYREKKNNLPFPAQEISKSITRLHQVDWLINRNVDRAKQPVIMRSMNTGPDLFYYQPELKKHLRSVLAANIHREFLYFFRTYILYKPAGLNRFHVLGRLDSEPWYKYRWYTTFDWDRYRKLEQAIHQYDKYLELKDPGQPTGAKYYKP